MDKLRKIKEFINNLYDKRRKIGSQNGFSVFTTFTDEKMPHQLALDKIKILVQMKL